MGKIGRHDMHRQMMETTASNAARIDGENSRENRKGRHEKKGNGCKILCKRGAREFFGKNVVILHSNW